MEEVGEKIGITRERVRQLQEQAIRHARKKMHQHEKQFTVEEIEERNRINERQKILKDLLGNSKHWHMLDIGVVLHSIAHNVVSVVVRFPPAASSAFREEKGDGQEEKPPPP